MLIGNNWKVECPDNYNVTVYHRAKPKKSDAKENWSPDAYFATPAGALHYIVNQEIKGTGLKDFQTVVERLESINLMIDTTLRQIRAL